MITNRDLRLLKVAESASELSQFPRIHIGSCVFYKNEVVGVGINKIKTHPRNKKVKDQHFFIMLKD
jgi:deoxycytidylate deaminase